MKRTLGSKACLNWVLSGICRQDLLGRTITCRACCLQKELERMLSGQELLEAERMERDLCF